MPAYYSSYQPGNLCFENVAQKYSIILISEIKTW